MGLSVLQSVKVGAYVMKQKLTGTKKFPLVLMLEPLFRCNLECAGCGKIQYPEETLKKRLSFDECMQAIDECGAPVISIAGGEPLMHPEMPQIAQGYVDRKKFVYLCTNAILLEKRLHEFKPSPYLTFSIHLDGLEKRHDTLVCREGVFKAAVAGIRAAKAAGFRVTTNTTVFEGEKPEELHALFDFLMMELKTDGMMISPGYAYQKAPDQEHFLRRERTKELFRKILAPTKNGKAGVWQFNHSSFFLDFLSGEKEYQCTPWGNPTRNVFGWQKPCYLMSDGYATSFKELMETTDWDQYGTGKDPRCADCMVHCGYEPTAVMDSTANFKNMWKSFKDVSGLSRKGASSSSSSLPTSQMPSTVSSLPVINKAQGCGCGDSGACHTTTPSHTEKKELVESSPR